MIRLTVPRVIRALTATAICWMLGTPTTVAADSSSIAECRAIADDAARLRCFDQIDRVEPIAAPAPTAPAASAVQVPVNAPEAPPAPVAAVPSPAPAPPTAEFGARALPKPVNEEPKALSARLVGKLDGIYRGLNLQLDNGQAWLVIDDREFEFAGSDPEVTLDRNIIGTYWMKIASGGPRFKVRRVH